MLQIEQLTTRLVDLVVESKLRWKKNYIGQGPEPETSIEDLTLALKKIQNVF